MAFAKVNSETMTYEQIAGLYEQARPIFIYTGDSGEIGVIAKWGNDYIILTPTNQYIIRKEV